MRWVEIISARLAVSTPPADAKQLFRDIRKHVADETRERIRVAIYRDCLLESDWAIHLHRDAGESPPGRTRVGLKLADDLRRMALVDHSVWLEET